MPTPNHVAHFAINVDDIERAQRFYTHVFGWKFEAWGPPGFFMISGAGMLGSLQKRTRVATGKGGLEFTIAVASLAATEKAVVAAGGTIAMPRMTIPTVGQLIHFVDPEGNEIGAMQYE
jgi:hypothetical protein